MFQLLQLCRGGRIHSIECEQSLHRFCPAPRCNSDETGIFLFQQKDAAGIRGAIEDTIGADMQSRVQNSLQETVAELREEHPEEAKDLLQLRMRSISELDDFVEGKLIFKGSTEPCAPPRTDDAISSISQTISRSISDGGRFLSFDNLLDHEQVMEAIYNAQGLDLSATQEKARQFLQTMGLRPVDMGVKNVDDQGRELLNQCFYLSLARGYLGEEAPVGGLALRMRNAIETSVLVARPSWAGERGLGSDDDRGVMAFADFLPIAMHAPAAPNKKNLLSELVVCILDSVAGHVEVYIGPNYATLENTEKQERNLILLWYTPGHYQCVACDDTSNSKVWMTYTAFKEMLTEHGVEYIETTE